jgi:hypothetical protein
VRSRTDDWLLSPAELVLRDADGARLVVRRGALVRDEADEPLDLPCPRERADELSALRAWVLRHAPTIERTDVPLAEPIDGGARLHRLLSRLRRAEPRTGDDADRRSARRAGTAAPGG